jgi:hypothetical protein
LEEVARQIGGRRESRTLQATLNPLAVVALPIELDLDLATITANPQEHSLLRMQK